MHIQHTPAPWKPMGAGISATMVSVTNKAGRRVAMRVAVCKDGDRETVQANARLIAAAPDLLAACEALIKTDDLQKAIDLARAALAKVAA